METFFSGNGHSRVYEGGFLITVRINVRDTETGSRIEMDLEPENTMEDAIDSAAQYWNKNPGAYVLKFKKRILRGRLTVSGAELKPGDLIELIPDPEGGK
jgi:hypothetical protein